MCFTTVNTDLYCLYVYELKASVLLTECVQWSHLQEEAQEEEDSEYKYFSSNRQKEKLEDVQYTTNTKHEKQKSNVWVMFGRETHDM